MEILLTGNTSFVTPAWMEHAFPKDHVRVTRAPGQTCPPQIKSILLDSTARMAQLVETYEFDRIVYFSEYLTAHSPQEGELDRLRRVLQANRERPVQLLYLAGPEGVLTPASGKSVLAGAAQELCRHYAKTSKLQIKVLQLPYLYGSGPGAGLEPVFRQMPSGTVSFEEQALEPVYTLCMEDLAELVLRVFDRWTPEWEIFTVPMVFAATYEQLGEALKALCPGLRVTYGTDALRACPPDDGCLRQKYGWFPRYALLDDLPGLYKSWADAQQAQEKQAARVKKTLQGHRRLLAAVEILAAAVGTEALVQLTGTQAQFRMVDFRLMFIVLVATMYGLNAGVAAALLASASLMFGYWVQGSSPLLLFYEPSNWLAFLVYFVVGAVCGYVQLRNAETIRFVREESRLLTERLRFVRQLYQDTLEDKRALRRQILGRKDSFGKIYSVIRKLDVPQEQELCRRAVHTMEDVLENRSVAIYRVQAGTSRAPLAACSTACADTTPKVLDLREYEAVLRSIRQDGVWVNRGLSAGLPMFAAAVRREGRPVLLLFLQQAAGEQLSLYYQNLFCILCGLVETAYARTEEGRTK